MNLLCKDTRKYKNATNQVHLKGIFFKTVK
jgi:hypothetical protein